MVKKRADTMLLERGLVPSRQRAQSLIIAGAVYCEGHKITKPSDMVPDEAEIEIRENPVPFVGRGGLKLQKAIETFDINVVGMSAIDIGASTGGFTDCLLKHGAGKVYAIDVGYGQLDWSIRNDPRVVVMERTNARNITPGWFKETVSFACIDVSFISIRHILRPLYDCLSEGSDVVALVKPQFEAGRENVGKKGVVRDKQVHIQVLKDAAHYAKSAGYAVIHSDYSPIKGPEGNIEFLLHLNKGKQGMDEYDLDRNLLETVENAHNNL